MKSSFIAIPAILANIAVAAPVEKRNVVWTSVTVEDVVTVGVTTTVMVGASSTSASAVSAAEFHPSGGLPHYSPPAPATTVAAASTPVAPPPAPTSTSSSSVYIPPPPAPTTSSSSAPYVPPPPPATSSAAPAPAPSAPSGGSGAVANFPASANIEVFSPPKTFPAITSGPAASGTSYTGDATYFATGSGACGWDTTTNNNIVAVAESMFDQYGDSDPNNNPMCGKSITINYGGKSFPAVVVDRCTGCADGDLDYSQNMFEAIIGSTSIGRQTGVSWSFD